ncbi:MAG: hypothetical protein FJ319_13720 [SAR202 cluster bacterium]|nr:hypothetical protein [SAR202 cluster bacterium]
MDQKVTVILVPHADGEFTVVFPFHDGIATSGDSVEEAMRNAREAFELHVEGMAKDGEELNLHIAHLPGARIVEIDTHLSNRVERAAKKEAERWKIDQPTANLK